MRTMPKVLVVEDDSFMQDAARALLTPIARVVIAGSLFSAFEALGSHNDISFIVLDGRIPSHDDIKSPNRTTLDLAYYIKEFHHATPVYAASADDKLNKALIQLGCLPTDKFSVYRQLRAVITGKAAP